MIDHATGIVIGETAHVGDGCTLLHGVTLGGTGKVSLCFTNIVTLFIWPPLLFIFFLILLGAI